MYLPEFGINQVFKNLLSLIDVCGYLIIVLICISLITYDLHLFFLPTDATGWWWGGMDQCESAGCTGVKTPLSREWRTEKGQTVSEKTVFVSSSLPVVTENKSLFSL